MDAIVERLAGLLDSEGWRPAFEAALDAAAAKHVAQIAHVRTVDDYLRYIDDMVHWAPRESGDSRLVHDKLVEFHFILDQAPLRALQSAPSRDPDAPLTPLSQWIVDYASSWGRFLDTPASAAHIDSFRTDPAFRWNDYMPPPSGYQTFNQFFARHVKPGVRPVEAPGDDGVVVAPADANFIGAWPIDERSTIVVDGKDRDEEDAEAIDERTLDLKGMRWSIQQLLEGSAYAERFAGGVFTHSALRTFDYHRWHAPVAGTVLEARVIQGRAWLDVKAVPCDIDGEPGHTLEAQEGTGYQFSQARGLVVLDSPAGLVACLPVGMAQVSSVVITAEVGRAIRKGEELGYFQFGGSDFVMVFERAAALEMTCCVGEHAMQGRAVGRCRPRMLDLSAMPGEPPELRASLAR